MVCRQLGANTSVTCEENTLSCKGSVPWDPLINWYFETPCWSLSRPSTMFSQALLDGLQSKLNLLPSERLSWKNLVIAGTMKFLAYSTSSVSIVFHPTDHEKNYEILPFCIIIFIIFSLTFPFKYLIHVACKCCICTNKYNY